jgi:cyanophycin synthetase
MRVVDSRRLRGPNLQTREPAALAEVALEEGESANKAARAWRGEITRIAEALGWKKYARSAVARPFPGGIAFALPAPIDVLLEAVDVNEWALASATAILAGRAPRSLDDARVEFLGRIAAHDNPRLRLLREGARRRDVPFLWGDDKVTLGMGRCSKSFDLEALPSVAAVAWNSVGRIPVALVTGTNGKTTTARLVARMAKLAGMVSGSTSTDGVAIDEKLVEEGDFTGGEGARIVLRHADVELAVLETARGGILRRGLAVDACDAAVITNVSSDHVGEFGVYDVETMVKTKAVVGTVVRPAGRVVLNGDDPSLVPLIDTFAAKTVLFGLDARSKVLRKHLEAGGEVFTVRRGNFVRRVGQREKKLGRVVDAPLCFHGAATYNVANALAAAALAWSLGLPDSAIAGALSTFGRLPEDNPGRGWLVPLAKGPRVLFDFGHNPAGLRGVYELARSLAGARGDVLAVHTQPGDRTAEDTRALAVEIARGAPRLVALWESPEYRRGRREGDIAAALRAALVASGVAKRAVVTCKDEASAVKRVLKGAFATDVVIVAPHVERSAELLVLKKARPSTTAPSDLPRRRAPPPA